MVVGHLAFDEVLPPRHSYAFPNPTQQLDFARFSSDALKEHLIAEREILRRLTPDIAVTTNFMIMGETRHADYADWAHEIDFVSNDHYVTEGRDELAFSAALTSGVAHHRPWFLMEHSTSAVNWQPINRPKRSNELVRDSLTHVAHGADAVCYFQWRQSAAGAEKYHSSMVPHGGEDTRVYREVVRLGGLLQDLAPVAGADRDPAQVAILFDWDSWWGSELDSHPTDRLRYRREALDWWGALLDAGIRADVVPVDADLSGYRLVIAPVLYAVPADRRARLEEYVRAGCHLVATYFSGVVNEDDRVWLGGYPGAFRDLVGVRVEGYRPLWDGETIGLSIGARGSLWSEPVDVIADDVEVLATYTEDDLACGAAVTWRPVGAGGAGYVSTRLGVEGLGLLLPALLERAGGSRRSCPPRCAAPSSWRCAAPAIAASASSSTAPTTRCASTASMASTSWASRCSRRAASPSWPTQPEARAVPRARPAARRSFAPSEDRSRDRVLRTRQSPPHGMTDSSG